MKRWIKSLAFASVVLFFAVDSYGQSASIIKLLNKGNYAEAYEKLTSSYKDTNSVERFELLYRYYADTNNPQSDFCQAYRYANLFNSQTNSEKVDVAALTKQALAEVYRLGEVDAMEKFVECFKDEKEYVKEANRLLEQKAFEQAQRDGTIAAYEAYVAKYPLALQSSLARQELDRLVVEEVLESEDLQKLRAFVLSNNNPQYVAQAKTKIEKLVFAEALESNTVESYSDYLTQYPNGSYHKLASQRLNEVLYARATQSGKLSELIRFVIENPKHQNWASAYELLKRRTFSQLSIAGMKVLEKYEQDTRLLERFAKRYLTDTRKSTSDTLLAYFPSIASFAQYKNAEKAGKTIDLLLKKPVLLSDDFKSNKALFFQEDNIQSYALVMKYLAQTEGTKAFNKQIYSPLTISLQQSSLLPFYIEQKVATDSTSLAFGNSNLLSAHTAEGFCFEASSDNRDIYAVRSNGPLQYDTILLSSPLNSRYDETSPVLSPDGKSLFFASNAGVNYGGLDIYVSHREDTNQWDNWSEPILLGKEINSAYDDVPLGFDGKQLLVQGGRVQSRKICLFDKQPEFISGYLLNQSGKFLRGEILILDSVTLDTLFITHSNSKGYFAYVKPEQPYLLHSQINNHINFFSSDLSQVVVQSIEDLISTKKLYIAASPFMDKKYNHFSPEGRRELLYLAHSVRHINYTMTISVHVHSEDNLSKATEIADQQAEWIAKWLIKNGVPKEKLIVVGYGDKNPLIGWEGKDRIEIGFLNN